jgi:hypothetical protein
MSSWSSALFIESEPSLDFSGINVLSAAFFVAGDADELDARAILLLLPVVTFVWAIVLARFAFTRPEMGILAPLLSLMFGLSWMVTDPGFVFLALSRVHSQPSHKNRSYIVL